MLLCSGGGGSKSKWRAVGDALTTFQWHEMKSSVLTDETAALQLPSRATPARRANRGNGNAALSTGERLVCCNPVKKVNW